MVFRAENEIFFYFRYSGRCQTLNDLIFDLLDAVSDEFLLD